VDPRLRGGTGQTNRVSDVTTGGPPLTRGNRKAVDHVSVCRRWTPAYAGEPARHGCIQRRWQVDPRLRGGTGLPCYIGLSVAGGPPLTRGNRASVLHRVIRCG